MRTTGRISHMAAGIVTRSWWLHPFLAAAFPVVFLFAANIREQITVQPLLGPLGAALGGALLLTSAIVVALRPLGVQPARSAQMATLLVALFFSYGHVWNAAADWVTLHRYLLAVWGALAVVGLVVVLRVRSTAIRSMTGALNIAGMLLVAVNIVPILPLAMSERRPPAPLPIAPSGHEPAQSNNRDVWYLVFDRYAGRAALREAYGFDNTPFLEELERRGFAVADRATANYLKTAHSLASTLEMDYLDAAVLTEEAAAPDDWTPLYLVLQGSHAVERFLHERGYEYLHLGVRRGATYTNAQADRIFLYNEHTEFAAVLLDTTLLVATENVLAGDEPGGIAGMYGNSTLYQFNVLEQLAKAGHERPRFVLAHLLLPHPPYVFNADGSWVTPEEAAARSGDEQYLEQVEYANARILGLLDVLLDVPADERPIVLIQSDEGPFPERYAREEESFAWMDATHDELLQKFSILAAYHVPELADAESGVYAEITPVNSFRLIFRTAFDAELALLPDRNLVFVDQRHIYEFVDVTDRVEVPR